MMSFVYQSPHKILNVSLCEFVLQISFPQLSGQEGLFKIVILNEWLGAPAIITTMVIAVSQKWIYLLQHPEADFSTSRPLSVDIEMQPDIDYSIRNLILQVGLPSRGSGAQGEGIIKC